MLGLDLLFGRGGGGSSALANFTADDTSVDTATAVTFSYTGGGSVASYLWDFGDGNTATTASPTHTYAAVGSYTVTLTVVLAAGAGTKSKTRRNYVAVTWAPDLVSGLLIDWTFDEVSGAALNHAAAAHAGTNRLLCPERRFDATIPNSPSPWTTSGTLVDGYAAGPTGASGAASRLTGTGNIYFYQQCDLPAGQWTGSVRAKSNTGSDQQMRVSLVDSVGGLVDGSLVTLPADGSWVTVSTTRTTAGAVTAVYFRNDASSALDVSVAGAWLEAGASAGTYDGGVWDLVPAPYSDGPAWGGGHLDFLAANRYAIATAGAASAVTSFAAYFLLRQPGDAPSPPYLTVLGDLTYPGGLSVFGSAPAPDCVSAHFDTDDVIAFMSLRSANYRVLGVICDGTTLTIELDGVTIASGAASGSATLTAFQVCRTNTLLAGQLKLARACLWTDGTAFDAVTRANAVAYMRSEATRKGLTTETADTLVVFFGDSFTKPLTGVTGVWCKLVAGDLSPAICDDLALSGTNMSASPSGGYPDQRTACLARYTPGDFSHSVAVLAFGQNDLNGGSDLSATLLSRYATAYTQLKADGFKKVVVVPPWSRNVGANQTHYDTACANLRAGLVIGTHCDYVTPTSALMSAAGSYSANPTYYTGDGSHPNDAGQAEMYATTVATVATAAAA